MRELPIAVDNKLAKYMKLFNEYMPNRLAGLYLHGSLALDAFVEGSSDIDFIAVTHSGLTQSELKKAEEIHRIIADKNQFPEMDGVYITQNDLGTLRECFFYNNGRMNYGQFLNPVIWWLLKKKGIAIYGDLPVIAINDNDLVSYTYENMNTYWANRIRIFEKSIDELAQKADSEIDIEVEWTVLGILRQFYTLREKDIISKQGAGEYSLKHLPEKWHPIILDAVNIRLGEKSRHYAGKLDRIEETISLSKYLISQSAAIQNK
ncbi:aminoglycoside adenylyltransferase domain-containing protein [Cytobacillus sp. FSL H8-0458]|uniref:aminoglycoside adenylyltransferase domain-containing protein n=1 Tax=Cytobacillus sp. FSL H8-0458 TaxID=2975346 RepID=UPI0030F7CB37